MQSELPPATNRRPLEYVDQQLAEHETAHGEDIRPCCVFADEVLALRECVAWYERYRTLKQAQVARLQCECEALRARVRELEQGHEPIVSRPTSRPPGPIGQ
jgi:hypothetical protein